MIFEEKVKETDYTPIKDVTKVRIDLEAKRENELQKINSVYSKEVIVNKKLGRTKIIKMAIDNLIADLNNLDSEEEQLQYLRTLYKEAEF